jgi:alginate O-acetyltransferase complex protein AlgI
VALADNISPLVDDGFAMSPARLSALDVWTVAFLFGLQIYFDFSAYSHIAIGTAKLMGITVPENFNFPYLATSFKDFWKRWHISLSSWIRDYLYLPLSGVKVVKTTGAGGIGESLDRTEQDTQRTTSLFATWAVMGLWHGANWTYVVWGLYHALLIQCERLMKPLRERHWLLRHKIVGWLLTVPFAMLGWILFRAKDLEQALMMIKKVVLPSEYRSLNFRENTYLAAGVLFLLTLLAYFVQRGAWLSAERNTYFGGLVNVAKYAFLVVTIFIFLRPIRQYIYFQF